MKTKFIFLLFFIVGQIYSQKYKELNQDDFYVVGRDFFSVKDSTKLVGNFKFINYKPTPSGGKDLDGYVLCAFDKLNRLNGLYREYDLRGKVRFEAEYQKGERSGIYRTYDYDGTLLLDLVYHEDGTTSGSYRIRRDNGMETFSRKHGKLDGELVEVDREGNLLKKANYINDTLVGKYIENYLGGKPRKRAEYINGMPIGKYQEYDREGNIEYETHWYLRENIKKDSMTPVYKQSLTFRKGEDKRFHKGKVTSKEIYDDEGALLRRERYHLNGNLAMAADYIWAETYNIDKNGNRSKHKGAGFRPDGIYKEFYENGNLKKIENWSGGEKNGKVTKYDEQENVTETFSMQANLKHGEYLEIGQNTELKREYDMGNIVKEVAISNSKVVRDYEKKENGDYMDTSFWRTTGKLRSTQKHIAKDNYTEYKGYNEEGKLIGGSQTKNKKYVGRRWSINDSGQLTEEAFYTDQGLPYGKHLVLDRMPYYKIFSDNNKLIRELFYDTYNKTKLTKELIYYETGIIKTRILYEEGRKKEVIQQNESNKKHGNHIIYSKRKDNWTITVPYNNGIIDGSIEVKINDDWGDTTTKEFPVDVNKKLTSFYLELNPHGGMFELILQDRNFENKEKFYPFD